jgi:hypothetical protein
VPTFLNWLKAEGWTATPEPEPESAPNDLGALAPVSMEDLDRLIPLISAEEAERRRRVLRGAKPSFDRFFAAYPEHLRFETGPRADSLEGQEERCLGMWVEVGGEATADRVMAYLATYDWKYERNSPYYWLSIHRHEWEERP